ncbi:MAG TPA: amidohydrolase family protein [Sedimentisphaerales bacterium]|nr:amidohydrolase family protein [Sedimentisphaerales bacterium]
MKIDTHQHFWKYNERDYGWMGPGMESLRRDRLPADLAGLLKKAGVDGTVAVQARQCLEETEFLLRLADENPFIKGVVGWVDLRSPQLQVQLESFCYHPKLRGVRHVVHDEPDDNFMLRDDFVHGISRLRKYNLTYDLLLFPKHLAVACELVARFPEQSFILDHISKPYIKDRKMEPWASDIRRLASFKNVSCKISGMVTEADWHHWKPEDFTPYMDTVLGAFGADRIMVGSDWPVCTVAGQYEKVIAIAADYVKKLSPNEQEAIWSANAKRIYQVRS